MNHQDELPLAKVSEVDEAKRQWLQGMRHPVDTVTEPEPAEILAEFIRQHSAAGQLVARAVFLSPPYLVAEEELSVLLESIKQNGDYADIACLTGSKDDYYYSTQAMSENYAAMSLQVVEQDICRAIALNRPGFPGECFICELRLPDHRFRWKHNKLFLLLPEEYGPAFPAIVDCYTSPPT